MSQATLLNSAGPAQRPSRTDSLFRTLHLKSGSEGRSTVPTKELPVALYPSGFLDKLYHRARGHLFWALVFWWTSFFAEVLFKPIFSPAAVWGDPLAFAMAAFLYFVIGGLLTSYAIGLKVWKWLGEDDKLTEFAQGGPGGGALRIGSASLFFLPRSCTDPLALAQPNPDFLEADTAGAALNQARHFLSGKVPTTVETTPPLDEANPPFSTMSTTRIFSTVLARALLTLSSIVYERPDNLVAEAAKALYAAKELRAVGAIDKDEFGKRKREAETLLFESETSIRHFADVCNLDYDGICDTSKIGGAFGSLFFTKPAAKEDPFIVLVFKGTGIGNFPSFVTDMSFSRVPASAIFGGGAGTAHKGFFTKRKFSSLAFSLLFRWETDFSPAVFGTASETMGEPPYGSVCEAIKSVALRIKDKRAKGDKGKKIPLWVTGHSLGSALALLAFARFLKSREDLGENIELRDFYGFGTLRLGDADFVSMFENLTLSPRNRPSTAWRVQNRLDIATKFPFGTSDHPHIRSPASPSSILNYGHVSPSIVLRPFQPRGQTVAYEVRNVDALRGSTNVRVVTDAMGNTDARPHERTRPHGQDSARRMAREMEKENPIRWWMGWFGRFFPCVYDHAPWAYYHALNLVGTEESLSAALSKPASTIASVDAGAVASTSGAQRPPPLKPADEHGVVVVGKDAYPTPPATAELEGEKAKGRDEGGVDAKREGEKGGK
ncbi:hypothetical protein JCM6882_001624 [Rhodosporidiobolus microsporus]